MNLLVVVLLQSAILTVPPETSVEVVRLAMMGRLQRDVHRQIRGARWIKVRIDKDITNPNTPRIEHRERYDVYGDGSRMVQRKTMRDGVVVREQSQQLPFFIEPSLLEKFEFTFTEPFNVPCGEHECWRLSFAPKPSLTERTDDEDRKMFATSAGTLLVEKSTNAIVRVDAHMTQPLRTWLYTVAWSTVTITQSFHEGVAVVATIEMSYAYSTFFSHKVKRRFYRTVDVRMPPS